MDISEKEYISIQYAWHSGKDYHETSGKRCLPNLADFRQLHIFSGLARRFNDTIKNSDRWNAISSIDNVKQI